MGSNRCSWCINGCCRLLCLDEKVHAGKFMNLLLFYICISYKKIFYSKMILRFLYSVKRYRLLVVGWNPVVVTETLDMATVLSNEFLDIQATIKCRFTLKMHTWHYKNIQSNAQTQLNHLANLAKWLTVCLQTKWL